MLVVEAAEKPLLAWSSKLKAIQGVNLYIMEELIQYEPNASCIGSREFWRDSYVTPKKTHDLLTQGYLPFFRVFRQTRYALETKNMHKYLISLLLIWSLSGCSTIYSRATYDFDELHSSYNIYYEKGSEDIAKDISSVLGDLLQETEKSQYISFKSRQEIEVYVFSDKGRYSNYSMASEKSRGSATKNEIYISPIIRERIDTLRSILSHELSHIHIRQYVGTWKYISDIPGWFHEGLAVEVSGGGGAERVSEAEAITYFKEGKHFLPRTEGGLFKHKTAHDYGLKPHMYYRQAGMFVSYLKNIDPDSFKKSYIDLTEGKVFDAVWDLHYGKTLPELWDGFMSNIQA